MAIRLVRHLGAALGFALALMLLAPTGASAVGLGRTCGGFGNLQCDAGLFCQYPTGRCGVLDRPGKCAKVPTACPRFVRPVCGCDGKTYGNDCTRQMAMVSKKHDGRCRSP
jgi:Kazal-type serine protease inhibitor-like protein